MLIGVTKTNIGTERKGLTMQLSERYLRTSLLYMLRMIWIPFPLLRKRSQTQQSVSNQ